MLRRSRWSDDDIETLSDKLLLWGDEAIGRAVGRSRRAVEAYRTRHRVARTRHQYPWISAGEAISIIGCSYTWLHQLRKSGEIRAHKIPLGRWWLYDVRGARKIARRAC
jgi:hypothetical protein